MSEDKVFQKMLVSNGHLVVRAPDAKVWHSHQYDWKSLAKRCKNEGLGWKNVGIDYLRADMIWDMFHPIILMVLVYGLVTLQIRSSTELLFPWIRPICIYEGNHSITCYIP
jgi:rhamnosyltransferase